MPRARTVVNAHYPLFLTLLIVLVVYSGIFANSYIQDDRDFLVSWKLLPTISTGVELLQGKMPDGHEGVFRPLKSIQLWIFGLIFDDNVTAAHGYSLVVHSMGMFGVYLLVKAIFNPKSTLIMLGLLWWALHPLHIEAIGFVAASFDMSGVVLAVFGMLAHFYKDTTSNKKHSGYYAGLSYVLIGAAFLVYELTLIVPIHLVLIDWWQERINTISIKALWRRYGGYVVMMGGYIVLRASVIDGGRAGQWFYDFESQIVATILILEKYVQMLLVPYPLTINHPFDAGFVAHTLAVLNTKALNELTFVDLDSIIIGLLTLLVVVAVFKLEVYWRRLLVFGLGWVLISLVPVIQLMPISSLFQERYAYLASVGGGLMLVGTLQRLRASRQSLVILSILTTIIFGTLSYNRISDWRNDVTLWTSAYELDTTNPMIVYKLGSAYRDVGEYGLAQEYYLETLMLTDEFAEAHTDLGVLYEIDNELELAKFHHRQAIDIKPFLELAHNNLGVVYFKEGAFEQALAHFEIAAQMDPDYEQAVHNYKTTATMLEQSE